MSAEADHGEVLEPGEGHGSREGGLRREGVVGLESELSNQTLDLKVRASADMTHLIYRHEAENAKVCAARDAKRSALISVVSAQAPFTLRAQAPFTWGTL